MNPSFDSTSFLLATLGTSSSGELFCKDEQEYITKKLNDYYNQNESPENLTTQQIIDRFHEIVTNIESVYTKIKQSLWYNYEKEFALDEDVSYYYRVGNHIYINDIPLNEYMNTRDFVYNGYPNAYHDIIQNFEDAPKIRKINFDVILTSGSFNDQRKSSKRKHTFHPNANHNIIKRKKHIL